MHILVGAQLGARLEAMRKAHTFAEGCMTPSQQALTPRVTFHLPDHWSHTRAPVRLEAEYFQK